MHFDREIRARHWTSYLHLCVVLVLLWAFSCAGVWPVALFLLVAAIWATWCLITNDSIRIQVGGGLIAWDSPLPWSSRREFPLADVLGVEANLDDPHEVTLLLWSGRRHRVPLGPPLNRENFLQAIAKESPSLNIKRMHLGCIGDQALSKSTVTHQNSSR